jgi:hypothetical protein
LTAAVLCSGFDEFLMADLSRILQSKYWRCIWNAIELRFRHRFFHFQFFPKTLYQPKIRAISASKAQTFRFAVVLLANSLLKFALKVQVNAADERQRPTSTL